MKSFLFWIGVGLVGAIILASCIDAYARCDRNGGVIVRGAFGELECVAAPAEPE